MEQPTVCVFVCLNGSKDVLQFVEWLFYSCTEVLWDSCGSVFATISAPSHTCEKVSAIKLSFYSTEQTFKYLQNSATVLAIFPILIISCI